MNSYNSYTQNNYGENQMQQQPSYIQPGYPIQQGYPQLQNNKKKSGCLKMFLIGLACVIGLFFVITIIGAITMSPEDRAAMNQKRAQEAFTEQVELVNKTHEQVKADVLKNIKTNEYYAEVHIKNGFEYIIKPYLKDPESLQIRNVQLIRTEKYDSYVTTKYSDYIKDFSCDTTLRNKELRDTLQVPIQIYNITYGAKNSFGGYVVENVNVRLNLETNEVFIGKD